MGVHGLWRLIEPSGKPVPLETLENKVLGVDISIWLHQAIKGFQDSKGAPVPNAHLLGIYHRVCKLLYFKIKPVFIFDGGVPVLKKQTIAKRNLSKSKTLSEAERLKKQLVNTLLKHSAISKVLSEKTKAALAIPPKRSSKNENMYALPPTELDSTISSSEDENESTTDTTDSSPTKHWDLHTIDMSSNHFKSLPVDVRHEILTELKETRKQNSWGRLHELPKQSNDFSSYQVKRLLKRQAVQSALEDAEKEMGGHSLSLAELELILKDHGVVTTNDIGKRIASDENTRFLYIKDVKQALEDARREQLQLVTIQEANDESISMFDTKPETKADLEYEEDMEKAIALSLQEVPSTSSSDDKNKLKFSFLENFNDADFESDENEEFEEVPVRKKLSSAQNYMMEYSGLTPSEISKILNDKKKVSLKGFKGKRSTENIVDILFESKVNCNLDTEITANNVNEITKLDVQKSGNLRDKICVEKSTDVDDTDNALSSTDDEFEEVTENVPEKSSMEIVIDPHQRLEDDLFNDIFDENEKQADDIPAISAKKQVNIIENSVKKNEIENEHSEKCSSHIAKNKNELVKEVLTIENENLSNIEVESQEKSSKIQTPSNMVPVSEIINVVEKGLTNDISEKSTQSRENKNSIPSINVEQMTKLKSDLQREKIDLMVEKSTKERMASNITDQMYQEAQDLLELFGMPYIVAPMEAEAQCAFLDLVELTDGTITDDSDIWLFGGHTVYKNFFNQSKYVMEFKSENIKHHFKLTREQMILLALLVGSDYTVGLQGVGPVTALEILATFPPQLNSKAKEFSLSHIELLSGLKEFRSWFTKGKSSGLGRSALKNKLKNIAFTDNFPSLQVVKAYLEPTVETSKEKLSWSKPDFVGLTDFAKEKFGWSLKKIEDILKPVMKRVEENQAQKSIKEYFKTVYKPDLLTNAQNQMSSRVKSAINRIGKTPEELIAEEMEALSKEKQKKSRKNSKKKSDLNINSEVPETKKPKKPKKQKSEHGSTTEGNVGNNELELEEPKQKRSRNRSTKLKKDDSTPKITPTANSGNTTELKEDTDDLKKYEDIAADLKKRRQKRNELSKIVDPILIPKKNKPPPKQSVPAEVIPVDLEEDEEIKLLKATASTSLKRTEEINQEVKNELTQGVKKQCLSNSHKGEIIHQKLRDRSNLLRNKLKAIEVFRKSRKGPGYIRKRERKGLLPNKDAELSESSSED